MSGNSRARRIALVSLMTALVAACDDDPSNVIAPPPVDPSGEWAMNRTVVTDDCGVCPDCEGPFDLRLSMPAAYVVRYERDAEAETPCEAFDLGVFYDSNLNALVWDQANYYGSFQDANGCWYDGAEQARFVFGDDTTVVRYRDQWIKLSGDNCEFPDSCVLEFESTGARCDGCWDACVAAADAVSPVSPIEGGRIPRGLIPGR